MLPAIAGTLALAVGLSASLDRLRGHHFSGLRGALGHIVVPLGVGLGLWIVVLLRPSLRARLTALVLSLVLATFGAEVVLGSVVPVYVPAALAREHRARELGVPFDARSQVRVVQDLRKAGEGAYPMVSPFTAMESDRDGIWHPLLRVGGEEIVALGSISGVRTVGGNELGRSEVFLADERGFNNPPGLWAQAPLDVALIGDSYTVGWSVPREKNFAAPILRRFPRTLNLGMIDAGPLLELGELREFGAELRPKVVIWHFYEGNDVTDLNREKTTLLQRYLDPAFRQSIPARQAEIDEALKSFVDARLQGGSRWSSIARLPRLRGLLDPDAHPAASSVPDFPLIDRVLTEAEKAISAWGGQLWFVYLPTWERFAHLRERPSLEITRQRVLAIAKAHGLPTYDMTEVLVRAGDPLDCFPFRLHGHYNERGYQLVGDALAEQLTASGVLAPTR